MSIATATKNTTDTQTDFLPLHGTDYVEFYVGNAKQAAHFYKDCFWFSKSGLCRSRNRHKRQSKLCHSSKQTHFCAYYTLRANNAIADHIYKHGDGVKVLALKVEDARSAYAETTKRGGKSYLEPVVLNDESGEVVLSGIHTYGDTVHVFVERKITQVFSCPGLKNGKAITTRRNRTFIC
jgi:4-hydroxyphenylpyruvate dioxygenase